MAMSARCGGDRPSRLKRPEEAHLILLALQRTGAVTKSFCR
jgi:hypothetical protein